MQVLKNLFFVGLGLALAGLFFFLDSKQKELNSQISVSSDEVKKLSEKIETTEQKIVDLSEKLGAQNAILATIKTEGKNTWEEPLVKLESRVSFLEKNNAPEHLKSMLNIYTLSNLRQNLEQGHGFSAQLNALKKNGLAGEEIAILESFSEKGVQTFSSLKNSFYDLLESRGTEVSETTELNKQQAQDWWVILKSKLKNLIRIEKKQLSPQHQSVSDILALTAQALEDHNLTAVLTQMTRLETSFPTESAHFKNWTQSVSNYLMTLKMVDDLMARLTSEVK